MTRIVSSDVMSDLKDLHRGLHITMDVFLNQKNHDRTEELLRQLDFHLTRLIQQTKVQQV